MTHNDKVFYSQMQNISVANTVLGSSTANGIITETQVFNEMIADDAITAVKIPDDEITYAKIQDMDANSVLVRDDAAAGDASSKMLLDTQILINNGAGFTAASLSGDVTMTNTGVVTVLKLNKAIINIDNNKKNIAINKKNIATNTDNINSNTKAIENINLPSGSIMAFSVGIEPKGWLECDGSGIDRKLYSNLFSAIDIKYGIGDGTNSFNVPDFRGTYISDIEVMYCIKI